jgi:hypothetical protein
MGAEENRTHHGSDPRGPLLGGDTVRRTAVLNQGQDRNAFIAPHLQAVHTHAQIF